MYSSRERPNGVCEHPRLNEGNKDAVSERQLVLIAWRDKIDIDHEFARILPPDDDKDDSSWIPSAPA